MFPPISLSLWTASEDMRILRKISFRCLYPVCLTMFQSGDCQVISQIEAFLTNPVMGRGELCLFDLVCTGVVDCTPFGCCIVLYISHPFFTAGGRGDDVQYAPMSGII